VGGVGLRWPEVHLMGYRDNPVGGEGKRPDADP